MTAHLHELIQVPDGSDHQTAMGTIELRARPINYHATTAA
jgi:hypothetical protein